VLSLTARHPARAGRQAGHGGGEAQPFGKGLFLCAIIRNIRLSGRELSFVAANVPSTGSKTNSRPKFRQRNRQGSYAFNEKIRGKPWPGYHRLLTTNLNEEKAVTRSSRPWRCAREWTARRPV